MPKPEGGLWHYVKEAFSVRYPVPGLGGLPVNWLALGVVGVLGVALSPGFLALGAGLELGFLALMAHNGRFRKLVDGRDLLVQNTAFEGRLLEWQVTLTPPHQIRMKALRERCGQVASLSFAGGRNNDPLAAIRKGSLDKLVWIFVRLLQSLELLGSQIDQRARHDIEANLANSQAGLAALPPNPDDPLRKSAEGTIDILKRRLSHLDMAAEKVRFIQSELVRIEQQVELLVEESALAKDGAHLSERIDAVTSTLDDTSAWMAANSQILGAVTDDVDVGDAIPTRVAATER